MVFHESSPSWSYFVRVMVFRESSPSWSYFMKVWYFVSHGHEMNFVRVSKPGNIVFHESTPSRKICSDNHKSMFSSEPIPSWKLPNRSISNQIPNTHIWSKCQSNTHTIKFQYMHICNWFQLEYILTASKCPTITLKGLLAHSLRHPTW
jgi:hypothetical protein